MAVDTYCIRPDYRPRLDPKYFVDVPGERRGLVWQPDVYVLAADCVRRLDAPSVLDVGCGSAEKLIDMAVSARLIGLDFGPNLEFCRRCYPEHEWIEYDAEEATALPVAGDLTRDGVVICADVIEHLRHPERLLQALRGALASAALVFLSTPDRERVRGPDDLGPPDHPFHVREWSCRELAALLVREGLATGAIGWTRQHDLTTARRTSLAVLARDEQVLGRAGVARPEPAFPGLPLRALRDHGDVPWPARLTFPVRFSARRAQDKALRLARRYRG